MRRALSISLLLALGIMINPFACHSFHPGPLPGAPQNATFATIDGVRLHYQLIEATNATENSAMPPVVLIHGFGSSLEIWHEVLPHLQDRTVLAIDLKGFGWSSRPKGDYSPREQARLVLLLMRKLGVQEADVVAHSWGASVSLALALQAPKQVKRLALYGAWIYEEQLPPFFLWARAWGVGETLFSLFYGEQLEQSVAHAYFNPSAVSQERIDALKELFSRPGTKAAALTAVRDQHYSAMQKRYKTIEQPTLLLWGREDKVARLQFGERLVRDLPNASLKVYGQCGHIPMLEAAGPSNSDLLDFLNDTKGLPSLASQNTVPAPTASSPNG